MEKENNPTRDATNEQDPAVPNIQNRMRKCVRFGSKDLERKARVELEQNMAFSSAAKYFLNFQQENPLNKTISMLGVKDMEVIMVRNLIECTERGMNLIQSFDDGEITEECQQIIAEMSPEQPEQSDAQLKHQTSDYLQMRKLNKQASDFVQIGGTIQHQFSSERNDLLFVIGDY